MTTHIDQILLEALAKKRSKQVEQDSKPWDNKRNADGKVKVESAEDDESEGKDKEPEKEEGDKEDKKPAFLKKESKKPDFLKGKGKKACKEDDDSDEDHKEPDGDEDKDGKEPDEEKLDEDKPDFLKGKDDDKESDKEDEGDDEKEPEKEDEGDDEESDKDSDEKEGDSKKGEKPAFLKGKDKGSDDKEDDKEDDDKDEKVEEAFKGKVRTVFDGAVAEKVARITEQLERKYASALKEKAVAIERRLSAMVDKKLETVTEQWLVENRVDVEASLRVELMESFLSGMKALFEHHYVEVPEDKIDLCDELAVELAEAQQKVNNYEEKLAEAAEEIISTRKSKIFEDLSEGLFDSQKDRLGKMAKAIDTDDLAIFEEKLVTLKETFIEGTPRGLKDSDGIVTDGLHNKEIDGAHGIVEQYAHFIGSRNI